MRQCEIMIGYDAYRCALVRYEVLEGRQGQPVVLASSMDQWIGFLGWADFFYRRAFSK